jgi:hypothetical protein
VATSRQPQPLAMVWQCSGSAVNDHASCQGCIDHRLMNNQWDILGGKLERSSAATHVSSRGTRHSTRILAIRGRLLVRGVLVAAAAVLMMLGSFTSTPRAPSVSESLTLADSASTPMTSEYRLTSVMVNCVWVCLLWNLPSREYCLG